MNARDRSPEASTSRASRSPSLDPDTVDWSQYGPNLRHSSEAPSTSTSTYTFSPSMSVSDIESTATGSTSVYDEFVPDAPFGYPAGCHPYGSPTFENPSPFAFSPHQRLDHVSEGHSRSEPDSCLPGSKLDFEPYIMPELDAARREADEAWYKQFETRAYPIGLAGPFGPLRAHPPSPPKETVRPSTLDPTLLTANEEKKENIPVIPTLPSTADPEIGSPTPGPSRRLNKRRRSEPEAGPSVQPGVKTRTTAAALARARRADRMRTNVAPGLEHLAPTPPTGDRPEQLEPPAPTASRKRQRRKASEMQAPEAKSSTTCGLEGCEEKLVGDQRQARAHIRSHYTELITVVKKLKKVENGRANKMFFCTFRKSSGEECGQGGYTGVDGLQRHIEDVHWGWEFACQTCGKKFSRRDVMKRHQDRCNGGRRHPSPPPGPQPE
ncbi:hypothetical protein C8Q79DRAFT_926148 [Trametes meyenii]|nr:hypothetical protein C8Q79DRAFT_926148 [Trametes meyenii]